MQLVDIKRFANSTIEFNSNCAPTSIGDWTFNGCKSLVDGINIIPSSVKTIGKGAFNGCSKLENIYIPEKVKSIGDYGFDECNKLSLVVCFAPTPPTININCFSSDTYEKATLDVANIPLYASATGWKEFLKKDSAVPVSDALADAQKITVSNGRITIDGEVDAKVYNMSGVLMGEGNEIVVPSGIYIVVVDGKSKKVIVK